MTTQELLAKVRRVEIISRNISRHLFSGQYQSTFRGRGMSFSEVRDYQYGDDVRNIDWNVTARTGEPHVKVFEEERELTVMLLVDTSASTVFGTKIQSKRDLQTLVAAVLGFSANTNNDKVGLLLFSDRVEKFIPPKKGRGHLLRILRELILESDGAPEATPAQTATGASNVRHAVGTSRNPGTNLNAALDYLNRLMRKRSICFVLSDFLTDDYTDTLRQTARRHDLIGIQIYDPVEAELPDVGVLRVRDPETGRTGWVDTTDAATRDHFSRIFQRFSDDYRQEFTRAGAGTIRIGTHEEYTKALLSYFRSR